MPRFDGTGPFGNGPMGKGMGPCGAGRRSGFGSGLGRSSRGACYYPGGWNRPRWSWGPGGGGYAAPQWGSGYVPSQDEAQALKQEVSYLQNELEAIQKRLAEIESA